MFETTNQDSTPSCKLVDQLLIQRYPPKIQPFAEFIGQLTDRPVASSCIGAAEMQLSKSVSTFPSYV